jgi:hypothetical protein
MGCEANKVSVVPRSSKSEVGSTNTPQRYGTAIHLTPPWMDVEAIPLPTPREASGEVGSVPEIWREQLQKTAQNDAYLFWHLKNKLPVKVINPSNLPLSGEALNSLPDKGGLGVGFSEVVLITLEENAQLVLEDHLTNRESALRRIFVRQGKNSRFEYTAWRQGNGYLSEEIHIDLIGEGASCQTTHLLYGDKREQSDIGVYATHTAKRTQSLLQSRSAADHKAQSVYRGLITIQQSAPGSTGYQHSSNLLLSDDATVDSLPELAIQTDDVSCTHGVTTTSLDEATLLYARSRGLSEAEATKIAIFGFYNHKLTIPTKTSEVIYEFLA